MKVVAQGGLQRVVGAQGPTRDLPLVPHAPLTQSRPGGAMRPAVRKPAATNSAEGTA